MHVKTQNPNCLPKPSDQTQRGGHLMSQNNNGQREFTSREKADVIQPMCFLPSQDTPSPAHNPPVASKTFNDLDIPYIDEDEDLN